MPAAGPQNTRAKQKAKARPKAAPVHYQPVAQRTAPRLQPEQKHVLRTIVKVARKRKASHKEVKAAVETGLVESKLRNLRYGDSDSQGWRQERKSIYGDPTNLQASIHRFFDEAKPLRHKYGRAGDLAAAVQKPAAPYKSRYQKKSTEADLLLDYALKRRR